MDAKVVLIIFTFTSGCVTTAPNEAALCDGTLADRKAHARALVADGGPMSLGTGRTLLEKLAAGCKS